MGNVGDTLLQLASEVVGNLVGEPLTLGGGALHKLWVVGIRKELNSRKLADGQRAGELVGVGKPHTHTFAVRSVL